MPPSEHAQWFAEEVQPHEQALRAYLRDRFPSLNDWDDIIQESYARILKAKGTGAVSYPKALLFTTARNAALDLFRRRLAAPVHTELEGNRLPLLEGSPDLEERDERAYRLEVLAEAVRSLPDRCREVLLLRFMEELSYKEIAAQLGISPETVKVHMAKGMRRCGEFFAERGLIPAAPNETEASA